NEPTQQTPSATCTFNGNKPSIEVQNLANSTKTRNANSECLVSPSNLEDPTTTTPEQDDTTFENPGSPSILFANQGIDFQIGDFSGIKSLTNSECPVSPSNLEDPTTTTPEQDDTTFENPGITQWIIRTVIDGKAQNDGFIPSDQRGKHGKQCTLEPEVIQAVKDHINRIPVDFNFTDIEEIFEVYDYLTPNDARAVLKKREEMGYSLSDFIVQFTKSFRRAPVIPEDVEMAGDDVLAIYPRANLFLLSDEIRKGQAGLYTSINGRKPFLNAWDNAKDWDIRMRRSDPDTFDLAAATIGSNETPGRQYEQSQLPVPSVSGEPEIPLTSGERSPLREGLCVPVPSEGQDTRVRPEEQCTVHSEEDVAPYNLRNRPAPYEVPPAGRAFKALAISNQFQGLRLVLADNSLMGSNITIVIHSFNMDENQHRNISYEIKDQILLRNDYEYLHKRTNKDGSDLWRCRKKNMCNATVKILNQSIVHESNNHTHPPKNISELTIESEMKLCLKNIQQNVTAPVSTIFEESIDRIKDKGLDLVTTIPLFENRKKTLYKKRNLALGAKKIEFKKALYTMHADIGIMAKNTTNNIVEAWNNHVKKFLKPKPNLVQFLEGIRKDSIFYWKKLQTSTNISKRSPESRMIKEKITLTVQELLNDKISVALEENINFNMAKNVNDRVIKTGDIKSIKFSKNSENYHYRTTYKTDNWEEAKAILQPKKLRGNRGNRKIDEITVKQAYNNKIPISE
ncbi:hypothetical protein HW555_003236, partial [Spodoptera exigua]